MSEKRAWRPRYSGNFGFLAGRYRSYECKLRKYSNNRKKPMTFEEFIPFARATDAALLASHGVKVLPTQRQGRVAK